MTLILAVLLGVLLIVLYRLFVVPRQAAAWALERFVAADYGLPPREVLDPGRAGPPAPASRMRERQAVADAAWGGDWAAAERWARIEVLQHVAEEDDAWLDAWRAADPGNCDAATLHASLLVHRAWAIRGSGYAHEVSGYAMNEFRALLPAAIEEARRASLLDPANPGPWVVMITAARGAQYRPKEFEQLWDGLVARAPHHFEGHWQALQYWCAKWFGSDQQMMSFARRAVRNAPPGSPLAGIYLHALDELLKRTAFALPAGPVGRRMLKRVAASFEQVDPDHELLPGLRHRLADAMVRTMMYGPALEQFRLIGPWCGADAWRRDGNAVVAFETARGTAAKLSRVRPAPAPRMQDIGRY